ncbi:expressed unknown protein [Seminavis robusta]|uniref:Uncharacterized protein n=1 Tax=Seminavis robusta TaxID=568900 RepID=A0A9N8F2J4_9STRA|nr:expressed unknown protein [Seminavis robusta]|eukprot:Sro3593_g349450.1 n/a (112) ;mRNA; r:2088-2423
MSVLLVVCDTPTGTTQQEHEVDAFKLFFGKRNQEFKEEQRRHEENMKELHRLQMEDIDKKRRRELEMERVKIERETAHQIQADEHAKYLAGEQCIYPGAGSCLEPPSLNHY